MSDFFLQYVENLKSDYPSAGALADLQDRLRFLVSDKIIEIPKSVAARAAEAAHNIYCYAHSEKYLEILKDILAPQELELLKAKATESSVLMAYDFHYDPKTDQMSLIEVNTNASAFLLAELLYRADQGLHLTPLAKLQQAFYSEVMALHPTAQKVKSAIIDEKIAEQKMFVEFLMYQDLFRKWGWSCDLHEFDQIDPSQFHFIYNRTTDFTFSDPRSIKLRNAFLQNTCAISPHPKEYLLLADKDRLLQFYDAHLHETIIPSYPIGPGTDADEIWAKRKELFFKPSRMFGGKAVYRGHSISRKVFQNILNHHYIAQEFRPAGEWQEWKFDLRFYAYKDQIHLSCARLYQGQVTGFSTPGGGLARVAYI